MDPRMSSPSRSRPALDPAPGGLGCWVIGGPFWSADGELMSGGRRLAGGALAWVRARGRRTVPIPGLRTAAQVEEDLAAAARSPLSAARLAEIDRLLGRHAGPSTGDPGAPAAEP